MCDLHNVTAWFHKRFGLCKINFQQMWWMASSPSIISDNKPPHLSSWLGCSWMQSMLTHANLPPPGAPVTHAGGLMCNVRVVTLLQYEIRWAGLHDWMVLGQRPQRISNVTFYGHHPGCSQDKTVETLLEDRDIRSVNKRKQMHTEEVNMYHTYTEFWTSVV